MARNGRAVTVSTIKVDAGDVTGPLELRRQSFGHGGISSQPLPERVVAAIHDVRPRLIRTFIQEYFFVYQGAGRFDWSRLDPYMDSLARTGAKVVAALAIKPKALFPSINAAQWRPNNVAEWQKVVAAMIRRYSVEQPIVTHWEIGNETDIGEDGGCPYLIPDGDDYVEYYDMTVKPILATFPEAKVGGPAAASAFNDPLPALIRHCARTGAQLDFVSWHLYHSDPAVHDCIARYVASLLDGYPGPRPETMVTEFNRRLAEETSVEDRAYESRRASSLASLLLAARRSAIDWTFYYHMWDQVCLHEEFAPFMSSPGLANMTRHWNEVPHRLGLFGVNEQVRPQYFVYQMLAMLGDEGVRATSTGEVGVLAAKRPAGIGVFLVNYSIDDSFDRAGKLLFENLVPGRKRLTIFRIDDDRRWDGQSLRMAPLEHRELSTDGKLEIHVHLPTDSVALVCLDDWHATPGRQDAAPAPSARSPLGGRSEPHQ